VHARQARTNRIGLGRWEDDAADGRIIVTGLSHPEEPALHRIGGGCSISLPREDGRSAENRLTLDYNNRGRGGDAGALTDRTR
jgi:hypothetical protein